MYIEHTENVEHIIIKFMFTFRTSTFLNYFSEKADTKQFFETKEIEISRS